MRRGRGNYFCGLDIQVFSSFLRENTGQKSTSGFLKALMFSFYFFHPLFVKYFLFFAAIRFSILGSLATYLSLLFPVATILNNNLFLDFFAISFFSITFQSWWLIASEIIGSVGQWAEVKHNTTSVDAQIKHLAYSKWAEEEMAPPFPLQSSSGM